MTLTRSPKQGKSRRSTQPYYFDSDSDGRVDYRGLHRGRGVVDVKSVFRAGSNARPALIYVYRIPPGASEGMHTHSRGDARAGSYDEYYYVVKGSGVMVVAGEKVRVRGGDHIYVPNGVAHGIENTARGVLQVHLVALKRR